MTWRVLFITEGSLTIGFGHLTRMMAIASEFTLRNIEVQFLANVDEAAKSVLQDFQCIDKNWLQLEILEQEITRTKPDVIIIDSYLAEKQHFEVIQKTKCPILMIDDNNDIRCEVGTVINPSLYGQELDYPRKKGITYCLGSKYVILRKPFLVKVPREIKESVQNVLVIFGGTDVQNLTPLSVQKLRNHFPTAYLHVISRKALDILDERVITYANVSAEEMKKLMVLCDFAISAAGQTIHELIATQTPFIAMKVAENQRNNVSALESKGVALFAENMEHLSQQITKIAIKETREQLVENQSQYVFNGANEIYKQALLSTIEIQKAQPRDVDDIYEVANEEAVRKWSITNTKIGYEEHCKWFVKQLNDKDCDFYVVRRVADHAFLGQIRINYTYGRGKISISFHERLRGMGVAQKLVEQIIHNALHERPEIQTFEAVIHQKNIASKKLFLNLGFVSAQNAEAFESYLYRRKK